MSKVLQFTCLKVHAALIEFQKTKSTPKDLLDGEITVQDIKDCISQFNTTQQKDLYSLIRHYRNYVSRNISIVKRNLREDYKQAISQFQTRDKSFFYPAVMEKYRSDINPITALCYEFKRCFTKYDPEDLYHQWLTNIVTDRKTNKEMVHALKSDIFSLEKILAQYSILFDVDDHIPLELFHAKQKIKDFEDHIKEVTRYLGGWG